MYGKGGLNITDIRSQHEAFCSSWVKRLNSKDYAKWKVIPIYYLNIYFGDASLVFKMNFETIASFPYLHLIHTPTFYKNVIKCWHKAHTLYNKPTSINEIRNEIIWGNRYILCNKTCLFMQNWIKSGFIFIDDICDPNGFLPTKTIQDRLNIKNNYLNES